MRDGLPDFSRPREGTERELVSFWDTSGEYYELARAANVDYRDATHEGHRRVLESVAAIEPRLVLDVGSGTGEVAVALAELAAGARYVGVDVSTAAPRSAVALGRPGVFLTADAERLPFRDASFDAVLSFYALEHFTRPREALAEMARVLRPGGVLGLLSVSYDRPLGTMPSLPLGVRRRGWDVPRWHPANVAVYAVNRTRFALRQAVKHVRYALDAGYVSFELVERPLVLEGSYAPDFDAVHVVSGTSVARWLRRFGIEAVESTAPRGLLHSLWAPLELRVLGRKTPG